jgi:hypothetical protein
MNSIAFIDTRINDYQTILAALPVDMEWCIIDPAQESLQIPGLAMHLVSNSTVEIVPHISKFRS